MPITINIKLMSGEVIPFSAKTRGGIVKYLKIKDRMADKVLDFLELSSIAYKVDFIHDDEEEKIQEQYVDWVNKFAASRGEVPKQEDYDMSDMSYLWKKGISVNYFEKLLKQKVDEKRVYKEDGESVNAFVNEIKLNYNIKSRTTRKSVRKSSPRTTRKSVRTTRKSPRTTRKSVRITRKSVRKPRKSKSRTTRKSVRKPRKY